MKPYKPCYEQLNPGSYKLPAARNHPEQSEDFSNFSEFSKIFMKYEKQFEKTKMRFKDSKNTPYSFPPKIYQ